MNRMQAGADKLRVYSLDRFASRTGVAIDHRDPLARRGEGVLALPTNGDQTIGGRRRRSGRAEQLSSFELFQCGSFRCAETEPTALVTHSANPRKPGIPFG